MEKRPRLDDSEGGDGNELPEPIIQHIQSFLGGRQAARTSVVSKSWYNACLTRPNLYFNDSGFDRCRPSRFWDFVNTTVQRYEESNQNISGFKIGLVNFDRLSLMLDTNDLIKKLLRLCVDGAACKLKFLRTGPPCYGYVLSPNVLDAEKIASLSVSGCIICRPVSGNFKCCRLKSIRLEDIRMNGDLFRDTFPCLEDLNLLHCSGFQGLKISSPSLKRIAIKEKRIIEVELFVPNIRRFVFSGPRPPVLFLKEAPSMEWESDISLNCCYDDSCKTLWFHHLRYLLTILSVTMCKVSLSIGLCDYDGASGRLQYLSRIVPKLGNLMLSSPPSFDRYSAFHGALLMICLPKFIAQYWVHKSRVGEIANDKFIKFLCNILTQDKGMYARLKLVEEVEIEIFDETGGDWRSLLWEAMLNGGSEGSSNKQKFHFLLKWKDV